MSRVELPTRTGESKKIPTGLESVPLLPEEVIEPTNRAEAQLQVKEELLANRSGSTLAERQKSRDPFAPLHNLKPFSRTGTDNNRADRRTGTSALEKLPPPPPAMDTAPQLVPIHDGLASGVSLDELPPPPDKPVLIPRVKVNAIIDDRVVLTFPDSAFCKQNGFKRYVTLSPGQSYDSIKLLAVSSHQATFEEFGKVSIMVVDPIR